MLPSHVRFHHANLPPSWESPPDFVRRFRSNSASAVRSKHKKLRHIPDSRGALNQGQSRQLAIHPDKQRMPTRLGPIPGKSIVAEPAVFSDLHIIKVAEIVNVQFQEIRQDWRVLSRCWDHFYAVRCHCLTCADHNISRIDPITISPAHNPAQMPTAPHFREKHR